MTKRILAWTIFGLSTVLLAASVLMPDENNPRRGILFLGTVVVLVAACGALVASRRPENAVGWILSAVGFFFAAGYFATQYAQRALVVAPGTLPGGIGAAWLQSWLWLPLIALIPLLVLCFPTGSPPSRRWRPVAWGLAVMAAIAATETSTRYGRFDTFHHVRNPLGVRALQPLGRLLNSAFGPVLLVLGLLAVASVFVRFRRSRGVERQQMKWFVYATAGAVVLTLTNPLFASVGGAASVPGIHLNVLFVLPVIGFLLIPVAIAVAILRHQAFDIDRVISRTLAYAIVIAFLGGLFALVVLVPTVLFSSARTPGWIVALATLIVFGLFRPVMRRVRSGIDRRFNRSRYDAARTIDAFAARLREEVDLDAMGAELVGIVDRTMQPSSTSLWMRPRT